MMYYLYYFLLSLFIMYIICCYDVRVLIYLVYIIMLVFTVYIYFSPGGKSLRGGKQILFGLSVIETVMKYSL